MEFRLLGPLEVYEGRRQVPLGGPRQRTLLAHLLVRANQVVSTDRLILEVWGETPPGAARSSLQSYISHLRKGLGAERIEGRPPGYVLRADPEEVDALRFERLVGEGRRLLPLDPDAAARTLREALSLWRGEALADVAENPALTREVTRLEELRLAALEECLGAELEAGAHSEVVPEVEALLAAHPLRERLWGHLILGLYRSGRQADALAAFGRARRVLAEELGIDPSPELVRLHQQVLAQDPSLDLRTKAAPGGAMRLPAAGQDAETPSAPPVQERKVVSVLFADISASTELASSLDPEDLLQVLQPFFEAMTEEIHRFGGTVEKYVGDAVLAVFGVPVAHEDDALRAVRAALAMQRRLATLNRERLAERGVELSMRVGVNTGEVVAIGGARPGEGMVTGEAVNLAARLETEARPGGILVGERTYRDGRRMFDFRPLGELSVKGLERPIPAWEVIGERAADAELALPRAPLIGRQAEIGLLQVLSSRSVGERRPVVVTVVAPAGMGKSRLAGEFFATLRREHPEVEVVTGRCLPYGDGLTYWPLAEILKADAGILDSDAPETMLEKAAGRLESRFSGEGEGTSRVLLASIGVPMEPDPLSGVDPGVAKELIGRAWRRYLESMAAGQAVLAIIEDLHWADEGFLDLLEDLMVRMAGPLLLLCLARPDLFDRRPMWGGGVANANTVFLSPLSEEESRVLLEHLLGAGAALPPELAPVLHRAEGNPFFLEELVQMLVDEGFLVRGEGRWGLDRALPTSLPDTIQGVIASRMDLLPPSEKRAIQDAAVVGRTFWLGALHHLGVPDPAAALEGLVRKGLVREGERSTIVEDREFSFTHVLIRDVAYASIPKARRARAHADVGAWVEEVTAGRFEEFAEILAHHFEQASDLERTARYATLAGHRKRRLFAADEAIAWYSKALDAAGRLQGEISAPLVAEVTLSRGKAHEILSRFPDAEADYRRAAAAAQEAADRRRQAEALAALAYLYRATARYEEGRPILEQALERARSAGATDLLVRILYTAGAIAFDRAEWEESIVFQERALELATSEEDAEGEAFALHGLCDTRFFVGPFKVALSHAVRSSELFRSLGQRPMLFHNEFMVGNLQWILGKYQEADQTFEACVAGCRSLGDRWVEALARSSRAHLRLSEGRLGEALSDAEEALSVLEGVGSPRVRLVAMSFGPLSVLPELHAFSGLERALSEALAISDGLGSNYMRPRLEALQAWLDLRAGHRAEARRRFEQADASCGIALWERLVCSLYELLAWEEAGSAVEVEAASARLCELAREESPPFLTWGEYGLALAAALRADWDPVLGLADAALSRAGTIGERPVSWRAARVAAKALSAMGRHGEAEIRKREAFAILSEMAGGLQDQVPRSAFLGRPEVVELAGPLRSTHLGS